MLEGELISFGENESSPVKHPETKIILDSHVTVDRVMHTVSELRLHNLARLTVFQKVSLDRPDDSTNKSWWIRNDGFALTEGENYSHGFGAIFFVDELVRSSVAHLEQDESDSLQKRSKEQFDNDIKEYIREQVDGFSKHPEVFKAFLGFLESDSREVGEILVATLKRKNEHVFNLARFPLIADYIVRSHDHYPEFINVILHSTSKKGHDLVYAEILNKCNSLKRKNPNLGILKYFSDTMVNPLIDAAEGSEEFTPNPFAEINLSKLYGDLFGVSGIFFEHKWLSFETTMPNFVNKLQTSILQASMRSGNRDLRKVSKDYFAENKNSLAAQMLLVSAIGEDSHGGRQRNMKYKEFIDDAFHKDSLMSSLLKQYFGELGTISDYNQVLGGIIDFANIQMRFGRMYPEDAMEITLQCLRYFKPETQRDIDALHEMLKKYQSGIIASKCKSLLKQIE